MASPWVAAGTSALPPVSAPAVCGLSAKARPDRDSARRTARAVLLLIATLESFEYIPHPASRAHRMNFPLLPHRNSGLCRLTPQEPGRAGAPEEDGDAVETERSRRLRTECGRGQARRDGKVAHRHGEEEGLPGPERAAPADQQAKSRRDDQEYRHGGQHRQVGPGEV